MARPAALAIAASGLLFLTGALLEVVPANGQAATNGRAAVTPAGDRDPGDTITVANATDTVRDECQSTQERTISVDILTSSDRLVSGPHTAKVSSVDGRWSVPIALAPDLAPGAYKAIASCYDADDTRIRSYDPAPFNIRLQSPGQPNVQPSQAMPGDTVQIGSGPNKCKPPKDSTPKVRASILDSGGNTRAEGEGQVSADGSWSVNLRVPDATPQVGSVTAICLARVGASAPYARYSQSRFTITAPPPSSTTSTVAPPVTTLAPGQTAPATTIAAPTTTSGPVPRIPGFSSPLPASPVAVPIVAEPTYTG
jgi:hypothetical protein